MMSASSRFYYKEICYDARSHERKSRLVVWVIRWLTVCLGVEMF